MLLLIITNYSKRKKSSFPVSFWTGEIVSLQNSIKIFVGIKAEDIAIIISVKAELAF